MNDTDKPNALHVYGEPDTQVELAPTEGLRGEGTADGRQTVKGERRTTLNGRSVTVEEESGVAAAETAAKDKG